MIRLSLKDIKKHSLFRRIFQNQDAEFYKAISLMNARFNYCIQEICYPWEYEKNKDEHAKQLEIISSYSKYASRFAIEIIECSTFKESRALNHALDIIHGMFLEDLICKYESHIVNLKKELTLDEFLAEYKLFLNVLLFDFQARILYKARKDLNGSFSQERLDSTHITLETVREFNILEKYI